MDRQKLDKELNKRLELGEAHFSDATVELIHKTYAEHYKEKNVDELYSIIMEELAEFIGELTKLQQMMSKLLRGKTTFDDLGLLEEIADVEVALATFKIFSDLDEDKLNYIKDIKLERFMERVQKGEE